MGNEAAIYIRENSNLGEKNIKQKLKLRDLEIKITMSYHFIPIRLANT